MIPKGICRLKVRGWRTIYHATESQKKAGAAILISDKLDFKPKAVTRDEEGHYIIIKGTVHQEDLTVVNIYAPNLKEAKYVNQLIGGINTPFTTIDRLSNHKINK